MKTITNGHIAQSLMLVGTVALFSGITVSSHQIPVEEMAYQEQWLGYMAILFVICSTLSLLLKKKENLLQLSVVWGVILLGGVEAIWGLVQILGLLHSNHSLYAVTGSFYNPGPYSGYLAMVFPVCLNEWLQLNKKTQRCWLEQFKYYISSGALLLILCVLPAGMSRSAWIAALFSGLWVYGVHHSWGSLLKGTYKKYKKRVILFTTIGSLILIITSYALFHLKEDSASGRLLMWKINSMAIAAKPFTGYGMGSFVSTYGMAQEKYFAGNNYSDKEELVAGSPEYAFNEYLQVGLEFGIPFLLLVLFLIGYCLWKGGAEKQFSVCGGVISVLIFALSSYPMQIPAFTVTFIFLLAACVVRHSKFKIGIFILMIGLMGGYYLKNNKYEACCKWSNSRILYNNRAYESAKKEYEQLYPSLKDRGTFLFEYGHCLHKLKEYDTSNKILNEAEKYNCDPMIQNIIGKNYQAKGEYVKAEQYLIRSTHRLPGRIYPYYLLAKLYAEPKFHQPEKLKCMVETVLTKEPKVHSTAILEMREEVKKLK